MNQFEEAKIRAAKRQERQAKYQVDPTKEIAIPRVPEVQQAPIERPKEDLVIDVKVTLPNGVFTYRFVKPQVLQNIVPSKLNRNEFRNRLLEGLKPLLGGVNEFPGGS